MFRSAVSSTNPIPDQWFRNEVQVHASTLRAWLHRKFPAVSDVDNLVQEAMTRVWQSRGTASDSPRAYLYVVARNLAVDQMRRQQIALIEPDAEIEEVFDDGPAATPAETTAHNQELALLTEAIQALPERCRQVLTLRKIYGLSQKQIATKLGIAEHTVEAHVANGMRRCADFFSRLGLP
jgi:RNA polymerase sigma-70 factor (ECF subfamily)